jgi:2-polyprenyl-3-methyl-5-hydroxy-6-metoxy-1,4-benzoquinol methylase
MRDLSVRSPQTEIMDDLNCSGEVVDQTLRELETINTLLGGNHVTINGINQLLKNNSSGKKFVIGDLGCGGGDILKLISRWSKKKNISTQLIGIDANPHIIDFAKRNSLDFPSIQYQVVDIFSDEFKNKQFDIIIGTLFFHHFDQTQLIEFFKQVRKQVHIGVVINDIHRHWFAFHSIRLLTKWFSKSAMVKFDAPLSVLRAFKKKELIEILKKAEIKNYSLRWMWAFRWQVIIKASN